MFARAIAVVIVLAGAVACSSSSDRYCYEMTAAGENNTLVQCYPNKATCVDEVREAMAQSWRIDPKNLAQVNYSGCAKMKPWCYTFESTKGKAEVCQRTREQCEISRKDLGFGDPTDCKQ